MYRFHFQTFMASVYYFISLTDSVWQIILLSDLWALSRECVYRNTYQAFTMKYVDRLFPLRITSNILPPSPCFWRGKFCLRSNYLLSRWLDFLVVPVYHKFCVLGLRRLIPSTTNYARILTFQTVLLHLYKDVLF